MSTSTGEYRVAHSVIATTRAGQKPEWSFSASDGSDPVELFEMTSRLRRFGDLDSYRITRASRDIVTHGGGKDGVCQLRPVHVGKVMAHLAKHHEVGTRNGSSSCLATRQRYE